MIFIVRFTYFTIDVSKLDIIMLCNCFESPVQRKLSTTFGCTFLSRSHLFGKDKTRRYPPTAVHLIRPVHTIFKKITETLQRNTLPVFTLKLRRVARWINCNCVEKNHITLQSEFQRDLIASSKSLYKPNVPLEMLTRGLVLSTHSNGTYL